MRLCVSLGWLPLPPPLPNGFCSTVTVGVNGNDCYSLANSCGIDVTTLESVNKGLNCGLIQPFQQLCCSLGTYPSRAPVNYPNGTCYSQAAVAPFSSCQVIANRWDVTV
jgi:hypothetical protein